MRELMIFFAFVSLTAGQAPTGTIAGVVGDPVGALVSGAQVTAVNVQTSLSRTLVTSDVAGFSFSALAAGEYSVEVKAAGFQTIVRPVTVETGMTTTSDFTLEVGEIAQSVTVDGAAPQIRYDAYTIGGSISRSQIDNIPTNGRNFLELAKSEPGVQPPTTGFGNQRFVPSLGAPGGNSGRGTRVTIDGGSIMVVGPGGSAMGFSQEAVQEFQVSTVNFDLSTGSTVSGAINAVTRSGSNDFHGTAFWFFRDHSLAAYPALRRDKTNPDPFFQRRQFGLALGGPIRRNRMFFFGNWERNEQRGVVATTLVDADFSHFSRITASPLFGNQINLRLDGRISNAHTAFVRYSHDGVRAFEPTGMEIRQNSYPSNWPRRNGWSDQSLLGVTSAFSTVVNDFRFSYFFNSSKQLPVGEHECSGCLGTSAPTIRVPGSGLTIGGSSVNLITGRRFHLNDFVTWQLDTHRLHLGVDWEHNRRGQLAWADEPATITLYSPSQVQAGIPVPLEFNTLSDILALPLRSARVGVGDAGVPQRTVAWRDTGTPYDSFSRTHGGFHHALSLITAWVGVSIEISITTSASQSSWRQFLARTVWDRQENSGRILLLRSGWSGNPRRMARLFFALAAASFTILYSRVLVSMSNGRPWVHRASDVKLPSRWIFERQLRSTARTSW